MHPGRLNRADSCLILFPNGFEGTGPATGESGDESLLAD